MDTLRRAAAFLLAALLCADCEMGARDVPPCAAGIPPASELLAAPAFSRLRFHRRVQFDLRRGAGYDLWGDSRFEYRSALEMELVPASRGRSEDDLCVAGVSLRLARDEDRAAMAAQVGALVHAVALRSGLDGPRLEARIAELLAAGAKYQLVEQRSRLSLSAGMVSHPSRGDFFVVAFGGPRP